MYEINTIILNVCLLVLLASSIIAWRWYLASGRNRIFRKLTANANNVVKVIHPHVQDSVPSISEPSSDIVIIFGWAGAELRHLRRVQEQYQQRKITSFSYIIPSIINLDRGISPHLLSPLFSAVHDHMQNLSDDARATATIHLHSFSAGLAACSAFMHVLRFFPRLQKRGPDMSYLLKHVAGVLYDSLLPIDGLRHVKVPMEFKQHVADILSPMTPIPTPHPVADEDIRLNLSTERMDNPMYILVHAFTMATYVTGLVLSPDRLYHFFWTPLITSVFAYHYACIRFCKPVRAVLARVGLARPDRVRQRYSSFPNELGPSYMPNATENTGTQQGNSSSSVVPSTLPEIMNIPSSFTDVSPDNDDIEEDIETGDIWMADCLGNVDTCADDTSSSTRTRTNSQNRYSNTHAMKSPHCGISNAYQLISFPRLMHVLVENPYPVPVLFLYSLEDSRTSSDDIQRLMYVHVRKDIPVFKASFPTGEHCGIILKQMEDYSMTINTFTAQMALRKRIELDAARVRERGTGVC